MTCRGSERRSPAGQVLSAPTAEAFLLQHEGPLLEAAQRLRDTRGHGLDSGWGLGPSPDVSRNFGIIPESVHL